MECHFVGFDHCSGPNSSLQSGQISFVQFEQFLALSLTDLGVQDFGLDPGNFD